MPNEVIVREETFSDLVRQGAGVDWPAARVAAINKLLPSDFQNDPASAIALAIRASRSGLDPFTQIHAWKNERGKLQFQTSRDGFIEIAVRDPNVDSLEFQHVYEGESFEWRKDADGKVAITHHGGLKKGRLLGAYCCAHMKGEAADHLEMRLVEDYRHLFKKQNWAQYLPDMLITRVISATVRLVCPASAGLYSAADFALNEADTSAEIIKAHAVEVTNDQMDRIVHELETIEAEIEDLTDEYDTALAEQSERADEALENLPDPTPESEDTESGLESRFECVFCGESFTSQQGLAGHGRKHPDERAALTWLEQHDFGFIADVAAIGNGGWEVRNVSTGERFAIATNVVTLKKAIETHESGEEPKVTGTVYEADEEPETGVPAPSVSDIWVFVRGSGGAVTKEDVREVAIEVGGHANMFEFTPDERRVVYERLVELAGASA